ncbi:MAG: hypothetical protein NVS3B12_01500 [Acidimicrobiales bacterium]
MALADQGRILDYLLPASMTDGVGIGTMVRVPLHGRRVAGWIVAFDAVPPAHVRLQQVTTVSGIGPAPDVVDLTAWAAWRWAGRRTALLRTASPEKVVRWLPTAAPSGPARVGAHDPTAASAALAHRALLAGEAVVRLPPAADLVPFVVALALERPALVVTPSLGAARRMATGLRAATIPVALLPEAWAQAAGGGHTVIGARGAVWAPAPGIGVIVVIDAHDGGLVEERAPSWSAWVVAAERARRLGVPCVLVSACPLLEHLRWGSLLVPDRSVERDGWAPLEILDRRGDDPRSGLLGERLVHTLRAATLERRVVCVLNRKGRVRLLGCRACGDLAVCEHCAGSMEEVDRAEVRCRRCSKVRPSLCQGCGSTSLRALRSGVTKVREELEALARMPVGEVTAEVSGLPASPVLIGTEAVLHRMEGAAVRAAAVVFLELDAELAAPRFRAAEDALALLARASRLVGGRPAGGRVVVQTRQPDSGVIAAALRADPGRLSTSELSLRTDLGLPPVTALAELTGDPGRTAALAGRLPGGVEVIGPTDGRWIVRARDHRTLCDALAAAGRPTGAPGARLRVDVDPLRV